MTTAHSSKVYDAELRSLRDKLVFMGSLAEEMIDQSIEALVKRDAALAKRTMLIDRRINRLECEVDELCFRILATRQPVASDLRFVTTALKTVTDLERVGDLGVNICERVIELCEEAPLGSMAALVALANEVIALLRQALDAFVARDSDRALVLLDRDDSVDSHYAEIFRDVLASMQAEPATIFRATRVQSIAKYLERIADHAMNVAENVVFLVHARDLRHKNRRAAPSDPPR